MRVGIDARLVYYQRAGISSYVTGLLHGLARVGQGVEYVVLQSRKQHEDLVSDPNFHRIPLWTPSHHPFEQFALPVELMLRRLDVLHSPDFIPPFVRTSRSVITVHDLAFLAMPEILTDQSASYYRQVEKAVLSADAIIAVSSSTKKDIVDRLGAPEGKIVVIPEAAAPHFRPVDNPGWAREAVGKYGLASGFVLFVGTIEPRKNLPTLFNAFDLLLKELDGIADALSFDQPVKLVICGHRGWLCDDVFRALRAMDQPGRVVLTGPVSTRELIALYNQAAMLVLPSLYEGFGLPALEAMACGTPVVASNVSSLPEVVGDAGLLVSPRDAPEIARAMLRLLTNRALRDDLTRRGLQRARSFSWERTASETLAVYRRVAES
ncbi:MAG: glycosyltransferase family 4 protein [Chloroflexi bacterium]|nr:glycosyltransferase family 4 protein [Chloroflexota bacterium]